MRHDFSGTPSRRGDGRHDSDGASLKSAPRLDRFFKRLVDVVVAAPLLLILTPVILVIGATILIESSGSVFYRCRRVGRDGRELDMLKFRKMYDGAQGPALAVSQDERFTRVGSFLARTKLDEVPQLWNVLKGEMSLVGPRPEDPSFVDLYREPYAAILAVKPGITGLSQLAFARESEVLDPSDRVGHYIKAILPQKLGMDQLYASRRSVGMDLRILWWTVSAVVLRREVAVHRETGRLARRAPRPAAAPSPAVETSKAILFEPEA